MTAYSYSGNSNIVPPCDRFFPSPGALFAMVTVKEARDLIIKEYRHHLDINETIESLEMQGKRFGTPAVKSKLKRVYLMLLSLVRGSKGIVNKSKGRFLVKVKT